MRQLAEKEKTLSYSNQLSRSAWNTFFKKSFKILKCTSGPQYFKCHIQMNDEHRHTASKSWATLMWKSNTLINILHQLRKSVLMRWEGSKHCDEFEDNKFKHDATERCLDFRGSLSAVRQGLLSIFLVKKKCFL